MRANVNGTELYYDVVGSQLVPVGGQMVERPVCFVLHGGPTIDSSYLRPWMDDLAEFMQLVYVDYRGTGRSERMPLNCYTLENTIDDLEVLRLHLGLDHIAVLGHSHGGFLALPYALKYPNSVSHLLLVATAPYGGPEFEAESEANQRALAVARPDLAPLLNELNESKFRAIKTDEEIKSLLHKTLGLYFHRFDPQVVHDIVERTIFSMDVLRFWMEHEAPNFDVRPRLNEIAAPTLIMAGRFDWRTTVRHSEIIKQGILGSELVIFEESGHQLYIEEHETFVSIVGNFIEQHPPSR